MRAFRRMASTDHKAAESCLDKLGVLTLVVMGSADPDFADPAAEGKLVEERTKGQLVLFHELGHYPQAEQPEEFLKPVIPFLLRGAPKIGQ